MVELRPYQQKFADDIRLAYMAGHRRVMGRIPTGGGKSPVYAWMMERAYQRSKRSILVAHRDELIRQGAQHLKKSGIPKDCIGIIKADVKPDYDRPIQVASIQSLMSAKRADIIKNIQLDFFVGDEFHHAQKDNQYGKCLDIFENALVLGLTATPARFDGKGFDDMMDVLVDGPTVRELIEWGYLADYDFYSFKEIDLSEVGKSHGDYKIGELERAIANADIMGDLCRSWKKYAHGQVTATFGINTRHVKEIVKEMQAEGIPADWIDYTMPLDIRRGKIRKLLRRETLVMVNCNVFSEGFDLSTFAELEEIDDDSIDIGCVQLVRPTKSVVLDNQQKGRCLRIPKSCREYPWMKRGVILDHANSLGNHGLPDDPHIWTLKGVELRRREDRERIEQEEREAQAKREREEPIHDRNGELVLIDRDDLVYRLHLFLQDNGWQTAMAKWRAFKPSIEDIAKANKLFFGYKGMWVYRQWLMTGARPQSISELKAIAKLLEFNWQWSKHEAARLLQEEGIMCDSA